MVFAPQKAIIRGTLYLKTEKMFAGQRHIYAGRKHIFGRPANIIHHTRLQFITIK